MPETPEERQLLVERMLVALSVTLPAPVLTTAQIITLQRICSVWDKLEAMGAFWTAVIRVVQLVGAISLILVALKTWNIAELAKLVDVK